MEIKEIVVSRSVRVNTGNYEGTEHFVSMKAEIDVLDDEKEEMANLAEIVEEALLLQLALAYKVRGKKLTPAQIAKHHGLGCPQE